MSDTNTVAPFQEPSKLFGRCEVCNVKFTRESLDNGMCNACKSSVVGDSVDDEVTLETIVEMFAESLSQIQLLTEKVDRLDERLCNLVVNEPIGRAEAKKMVDGRVHQAEVKLELAESSLADLKERLGVVEEIERSRVPQSGRIKRTLKRSLRRWLDE